MSIFNSNPEQDFTPRKIKFSDLYRHGTKAGSVSASDIATARQALAKAGYGESDLSRIFSEDKALPVAKMRQIAEQLNKAKVKGFSQSPSAMITGYLERQRIRTTNIRRRMHENMLESRSENIDTGYKSAGTSLNSLGRGSASSLNDPKSGLHTPNLPF